MVSATTIIIDTETGSFPLGENVQKISYRKKYKCL